MISTLKKYNINQLNDLVTGLAIPELYQQAKMRTLVYDDKTLKIISDYCTMEVLFDFIKEMLDTYR